MVGMAEKSSVISEANITDQHIAMVGYDITIQTEEDICLDDNDIHCRGSD